jgi:hypothetical protein
MVQVNPDQNTLTPGISKEKKRDFTPAFSRVMYCLFIVLAIYYFVRGQWMQVASNMGIALIFDPFNHNMKWQERPLYQKIWLLVHVSVVIIFFVLFFATSP